MNNRYLCNSRHFDWIDAVWPRIWFVMLTKSFPIRFMIYFVTKTFRRASSTFISNVLMKIRFKGHEKLIWHFTLHASPATIAVHIVISLHSYEFVLKHDRMTQKNEYIKVYIDFNFHSSSCPILRCPQIIFNFRSLRCRRFCLEWIQYW